MDSNGRDDTNNSHRHETWQERIVYWRYQSQSVPKRIAGYWLKAVIEAFVIIGFPLGFIVYIVTTVGGITLSESSLLPAGTDSILTAWLVLTIGGWLNLRCMLTEELELISPQERAEE